MAFIQAIILKAYFLCGILLYSFMPLVDKYIVTFISNLCVCILFCILSVHYISQDTKLYYQIVTYVYVLIIFEDEENIQGLLGREPAYNPKTGIIISLKGFK